MKELFMKEALIRAKIAFEKDEVPIGAVVVKNNEIIGYGQNRTIEKIRSLLMQKLKLLTWHQRKNRIID